MRDWELPASALVFVSCFVSGFFLTPTAPEWVPLMSASAPSYFTDILRCNLCAVALIAAGGFFLSVPSLIATGVNGALMGASLVVFPAPWWLSLHYPFEAAALILALAISLRLASGSVRWIRTGDWETLGVVRWSLGMGALVLAGAGVEAAEMGLIG